MLRGCLLAVLCFSIIASPQSGPTNPSTNRHSVTVAFVALNRDKHPYGDPKLDDLTVLDNKKPVQSVISFKKGSELPLRIGLLVDASASQRTNTLYEPVLRAALDFLNQVLNGPDDRVFVVKVTATPEASEFMSRAQFAHYRLNVAPEGRTALYDGVGSTCDSKMKSDGPEASRRILIILSDGDDNVSHIRREAAIEKAIEAGVVIFSVSTEDEGSAFVYGTGEKGSSTLEHLAVETGGQAFTHLNPNRIEKSFRTIKEAISSMYFVTFEPAKGGEKGLHRIELQSPGKNEIRFRAPMGYYVP